MAYTRTRITTEYSLSSDYSAASPANAYEITSSSNTKKLSQTIAAAITTGTKMELGDQFTTVTSVVIKNLDSSILVTASFSSASLASKTTVPAGDFVKLCTVDVASDLYLISASGTPLCEVTIYGT